MWAADVRVVQVDDRLLDAASQEAVRLAHEVLVQRVLAGHQHGVAVPGPAGPAPPLTQARHRAWEPGDERDVEAADVDAQLERLRRHHGVELVREQPSLDVAPLLRRVAGAVGLHAVGRAAAAAVLEAAADVSVHELRRLARRRERDHARAGEHALRRARSWPPRARCGARRWRGPRAAGSRARRALGSRRLVLVDAANGAPTSRSANSLRIGDGRRGEHEARVRAVLPAEPPQPADDLGDVAAEDPAVDVRLVQHHVPQLVQELGPALVAGQDADVEHVRVAEEDGGGAPQERPLVLRRVAVVDRRHYARHPEAVELARLVLRECLGREEEEGTCLGVGAEGLEDGELIAEALAARRPGAHDDVAAGRQQLPCGGLVAVQRVNACREERFAQRGRQLLGKVGGVATSRRLVRHRHDLLVPAAGEERLQRPGGLGCHAGVAIHAAIVLRGAALLTPPTRERGAFAPPAQPSRVPPAISARPAARDRA